MTSPAPGDRPPRWPAARWRFKQLWYPEDDRPPNAQEEVRHPSWLRAERARADSWHYEDLRATAASASGVAPRRGATGESRVSVVGDYLSGGGGKQAEQASGLSEDSCSAAGENQGGTPRSTGVSGIRRFSCAADVHRLDDIEVEGPELNAPKNTMTSDHVVFLEANRRRAFTSDQMDHLEGPPGAKARKICRSSSSADQFQPAEVGRNRVEEIRRLQRAAPLAVGAEQQKQSPTPFLHYAEPPSAVAVEQRNKAHTSSSSDRPINLNVENKTDHQERAGQLQQLRAFVADRLVPARQLPQVFGYVLYLKEKRKHVEFVVDNTRCLHKCIWFRTDFNDEDRLLMQNQYHMAECAEDGAMTAAARQKRLADLRFEQYLDSLDRLEKMEERARENKEDKVGVVGGHQNKNIKPFELELGAFVKVWGRRQVEKFSSFDWLETDGWLVFVRTCEVDHDPMALVYLDLSAQGPGV